MDKADAIRALGALAHEGRLDIVRLLARHAPEDVAASDIAAALGAMRTTISNQLNELERAGLVTARRNGRSIRYRVDLAAAGRLIAFLATDCCRSRPEACLGASAPFLFLQQANREDVMTGTTERRYTTLFICTANSARSIFAEAIMNRFASDRFIAYSAGSSPAGQIHPRAASLLNVLGYELGDLRPKSWRDFAAPDAPALDFVFTVCNRAANEECPVWSGQPMTAHWGMQDPAQATGNEAELGLAFSETYRLLYHRITAFTNLPIEKLDAMSLQNQIDQIGTATPAAGDDTAFNGRLTGAA